MGDESNCTQIKRGTKALRVNWSSSSKKVETNGRANIKKLRRKLSSSQIELVF